jgi:hypothetical protein
MLHPRTGPPKPNPEDGADLQALTALGDGPVAGLSSTAGTCRCDGIDTTRVDAGTVTGIARIGAGTGCRRAASTSRGRVS